MTIPSFESRLRDGTLSDSKLIIVRFEVYIKEVVRSLKLVEQVINPGERILFLDCNFAQLMIVDAFSEGTIFLAHEVNWSTPWRNTRPDETLF